MVVMLSRSPFPSAPPISQLVAGKHMLLQWQALAILKLKQKQLSLPQMGHLLPIYSYQNHKSQHYRTISGRFDIPCSIYRLYALAHGIARALPSGCFCCPAVAAGRVGLAPGASRQRLYKYMHT